jgi:glycosyltransferase involved in cell wall biosynthesis
MKILWVNTNFMHPTTKGGQIRTLEMLRKLHERHEIHYAAIEDPTQPEGPARAHEYCSKVYPFRHSMPDKRSPAFALQVAASLFQSQPIGITRFCVPGMGQALEQLAEKEKFDRAVCDFLTPASYFPRIERAVVFQHNVETVMRQRYAQHVSSALGRWYFHLQAQRMFRFEKEICCKAGHVVAVSEQDACTMRQMFGVKRVSAVPTGVDVDYLGGPPQPITTDLVFVGSMDWIPNIDGMQWFVSEVLPIIRRTRPGCSLAIVGRMPPPSITAMAEQDPRITVTGTVPDIRPHLWSSAVSIVPLRIGGGTRLKIYESMAARVPVVSTTVGAEGLEIHPPDDIRIGDSAEQFAADCLELLADSDLRARQAAAARDLVASRFSWDQVARCFERILESVPDYR